VFVTLQKVKFKPTRI